MFVNVPRGTAIKIVEVFPRDGLQALTPAECELLVTEEKVKICHQLADAGVPEIEVTSFAHPDVLPQFADAATVISQLRPRAGVTYRALVPNLKGLRRALASGVQKVCFVIVSSETYQQKNVHMDVETGLREIERMKPIAGEQGVQSCAVIGTAFVCPYEGLIPQERVLSLLNRLRNMGFREIILADTAGMADPRHVYDLCSRVADEWSDVTLGLHLHDRHGLAMANIVASLCAGVYRYETSLLGIGAGMVVPAAKRSMGNVATEQVIYLLGLLDLSTGIDFGAIGTLAKGMARLLGIESLNPVLDLAS
jgi:hydroxymethylglutaryl-CoA lyase